MVKEILKEADDKMKKAVDVVRQELIKIRTGKATTTLLEGIKVDYFGTMTQLSHLGNLAVADVHTLTVTPYDKGILEGIQKAIQTANIGLNPVKDGQIIRVPIPPLNEERRRELVKLTKKFGEDGKIAIRNVRRDAIEHLKKSEKAEHFSEDERKKGEAELQKMTDKATKDIDGLLGQKEKEIMEV
ncbi:MAG TPA: ribosome recycling factor [Bacteroidota bacterium]|nr:ribosome recycling factor [Bacteroidota bacterium]